MDKSQVFGAAIPGANYTSDPKNYPWHRPPEITTLDDGIELAFKKLTEENAATGLLTMIEMGAPITVLTHTFLMSGVGAGKWTPDFAILLAGPISHIIYLMAKGYGLKCDMGLDDKVHPPTKNFFKAQQIEKSRVKDVVADLPIEEIKNNAGGFMSMAKTSNVESAGMQGMNQAPESMEGMV